MRTAFFQALMQQAETNPDLHLIVGDLGFGVVEPFAERFPKQYLNIGIAEQNMIGVAAGLALAGKTVFVYSIANFPTLRCFEQIRNDVCYHKASVKVVSVGGGLSYGSLGMSHHATEDLAVMRALPEMTVVAPGDPDEAQAATRALAQTPGPAYLRLGRAGEEEAGSSAFPFTLGKATCLRQGDDLTIIAIGAMVPTALRVAERLVFAGLQAQVLSMHTLKPLDEEAIREAAERTGAIVTLEEHSIIGGLGSAVAEVLAESGLQGVAFRRCGLPSKFISEAGSQQYLKDRHGLSESVIVATALQTAGDARALTRTQKPLRKTA
jgi:transketolase